MQWNLIRLRKTKGLTQLEMAKALGISVSSYQNKETGKTSFKDIEMFTISKMFDKTIEEIFLPIDCINNAISN